LLSGGARFRVSGKINPREPATAAIADDKELDRLAARLGHEFGRPALLRQALTHPSALGQAEAAGESYERLEFLGDRVIALLVAELLLERFPREAEGPLAQRLAELVRRDTLAALARDLGLGRDLRLAKGEDSAGERDNPALLADACEAVAGALYLDGGLPVAGALLVPLMVPLLEQALEPPQDPKTALQEWAQGRGLPLPDYRETGRSGPDHEPLFTIEVTLPGHGGEVGEGRSKRQAEQAAAERLLARLRA
jgi:ribonuclease-3